jgi:2-dehydro-3-deoxygluconokinase
LKKLDLLTFGEVLLRLSPEGNERLTQGDHFMKRVGGAELNVAAGASMLGLSTGIISRIPAHAIGNYAKSQIQGMGVSTEYLLPDNGEARLGIYYYETGIQPRKPQIVYDRKYSSINSVSEKDFSDSMYHSARCFHTSGISLGLGGNVRKTAMVMIRRFKEAGALISFDVNYRRNLWSGEEARNCIAEILPYVDIFFCSESTAKLTFLKTGTLDEILKGFAEEYSIPWVVATKRIVHTPQCHSFNSVAYEKQTKKVYKQTGYDNISVVDRIGSGDAYVAGFLYGLLSKNGNCENAVSYGNASGALKNTVIGDMMLTDINEITKMVELNRGLISDFEMAR